MKTKNSLTFLIVVIYATFFWASSTPSKLTQTLSTYEDVKKKEAEPYNLIYNLPTITPTNDTKQTQTKGGVTITCEIIPFSATIDEDIQQKVFFADPTMPGYDVFEVTHTPKAKIRPDNFQLNIKIKNNQERILKVRETALLLQIDGITYHIPEASLTDWYAGMIIKNGEFNYIIQGPEFNSLKNAKLIYLFINDVPTIMDEGGNIKKRENFEWYFECKNAVESKQLIQRYTYETKLVESKQCPKCGGTGTDPQAYKCDRCQGKGTTVNMFDGKTYKCSKCSGSGIVHYECPDCSGIGTLYFPKSHNPKITASVTWSGQDVKITTIPAGASVKYVDYKTGAYRDAFFKTPTNIDWYCAYGRSCPIIVEHDGIEVKVLPYNSNGKVSSTIKIDFSNGTPIIKGGTKVN